MKMPADSVIVASVNILLIGICFLARMTQIGCCMLGSPANVLATVVVPILLLVSVFFVARDLIRPQTRLQAALALALSIPSAILTFSIKF
jgi:hypothetical protein